MRSTLFFVACLGVLAGADTGTAADGKQLTGQRTPFYTLATRGRDHTPVDEDAVMRRVAIKGPRTADRVLGVPDRISDEGENKVRWVYYYKSSTLTIGF